MTSVARRVTELSSEVINIILALKHWKHWRSTEALAYLFRWTFCVIDFSFSPSCFSYFFDFLLKFPIPTSNFLPPPTPKRPVDVKRGNGEYVDGPLLVWKKMPNLSRKR